MKRWLQGIAAILIALIALVLAVSSNGLTKIAEWLADGAAALDEYGERLRQRP